MPAPGPSNDQLAIVTYVSGLNADGTVAAQSFNNWNGENPATYTATEGFVRKWDDTPSGVTAATSSAAGTAGGTVTYAFDPSDTFTAAQEQAFTATLTLWSDESNIQFSLAASAASADLLLSLTSSGGTYDQSTPQYYSTPGSSAIPSELTPSDGGGQGKIVFNNSGGFGTLGSFTAQGGYGVDALTHEVGHVLGLGHSGPYNDGNGNAGSDQAPSLQTNAFDSRQWSAMSYVDPSDTSAKYYASDTVTGTDWLTSSGYEAAPETPMMLDILAAQRLYGRPVTTPLSGGQVFGFNTNITDASRPFWDFTQNVNPVITLWDAGGGNTIDLSGYSTSSTVNLNPGSFSSAGGLTNNIGIAFGTAIDSAIGGSGNDSFTVNADNDTITGGGGTDTVVFAGPSAQYHISGSAASKLIVTDRMSGRNGSDTLTGIRYLQFADRTIDTQSLSVSPPAPSDFNGDGNSDILFQNADGSIDGWLMNGASITASSVIANPGTAWTPVATGDFNGDGQADILYQNQDGTIAIWQVNGLTLASSAIAADPGPAWHAVATGDFDGDGKADILFQNDNGSIDIWTMNGASIQTSSVVANPGTAWHAVGTGDFNGDGKADILFQNDDGTIDVWEMNGSTLQASGMVANPTPSWRALGTGDFNADGKSDVVLQNKDGTVAIWTMNGLSMTSSTIVADPGSAWHVVAVGDYNGDGKADILLQNDNGTVADWLMNGTAIASSAIIANPTPSWQTIGLGSMHFIDGTQSAGSLNGTILSDDFVFTTSQSGAHVLSGFDPLHDVITLDQAKFGSYAAVQSAETTSGGSTMITLAANDTLTISGVLPGALSAKNFV